MPTQARSRPKSWLLRVAAAGILVPVWTILSVTSLAQSSGPTTEELFRAAPFARWQAEGQVEQVPWKVRTFSHGLSLQQRLVEHIEVDMGGRELAKRSGHGHMVLLVRVVDPQGHEYRNHGLLDMSGLKPEIRKHSVSWWWDAFALPGEYQLAVALYDTATGEHDFMQTRVKVEGIKNDPLPDAWQGLPPWDFWAPLDDTDSIFRPDIDSRLNLAAATRRPVSLQILADLTPSDLFHGSTRFYQHYLAVVVPLMKTLSQVQVNGGNVDVAAVDLRRRKVTFEQALDKNQNLDWSQIKKVLAADHGPATVDVQVLQQKKEVPDFLREELLRRMNAEPALAAGGVRPLRVFVVIGSPMDFYSFHQMPPMDPIGNEDYLVYYLQYELYNPQYASGALNQVRKLLRPVPVHTLKVRSPESIRHALARLLEDIAKMQ